MSGLGTIFITGSNRGIGLEFTKQYVLQNWDVIATCRNTNQADEFNELSEKYKNLSLLDLDITNKDSVDEVANTLDGQPIDLLINNAAYLGPPDPQKFGDIDYEMFTKSFEVNAIGPIRVTEKLINLSLIHI